MVFLITLHPKGKKRYINWEKTTVWSDNKLWAPHAGLAPKEKSISTPENPVQPSDWLQAAAALPSRMDLWPPWGWLMQHQANTSSNTQLSIAALCWTAHQDCSEGRWARQDHHLHNTSQDGSAWSQRIKRLRSPWLQHLTGQTHWRVLVRQDGEVSLEPLL